jgi:hypothetical protein
VGSLGDDETEIPGYVIKIIDLQQEQLARNIGTGHLALFMVLLALGNYDFDVSCRTSCQKAAAIGSH